MFETRGTIKVLLVFFFFTLLLHELCEVTFPIKDRHAFMETNENSLCAVSLNNNE